MLHNLGNIFSDAWNKFKNIGPSSGVKSGSQSKSEIEEDMQFIKMQFTKKKEEPLTKEIKVTGIVKDEGVEKLGKQQLQSTQKEKENIRHDNDIQTMMIQEKVTIPNSSEELANQNIENLEKFDHSFFNCSEGPAGGIWIDSKTGKFQAIWGHDVEPQFFDKSMKKSDLLHLDDSFMAIGELKTDRSKHNYFIKIKPEIYETFTDEAKEVIKLTNEKLKKMDNEAINKGGYIYPGYSYKENKQKQAGIHISS